MDRKDFVTDVERRYLDKILPGQADSILKQLKDVPGEALQDRLQDRLRESLQSRQKDIAEFFPSSVSNAQ